ncbi:MAG: dihydropteroate synthase [Breznakibacter sp.]|nr:dihydropteroate synthase [Breznakibacter sp.]
MGILNTTPDSFFDGGKYRSEATIAQRAENLIAQGAAIIDLGAYSSRPGADHISEEEEWQRLDLALNLIRKNHPDVIVSVDTFRSEIAKRSVETYRVDMINDISGGMMDPRMFATMGKLNVPYILMHMKGTPQNMQQDISYQANIMDEINLFFSRQVYELTQNGVKDIILDPGFGFGKTADHNFTIMRRLEEFQIHNLPILVGISRKSMIYKILNTTPNNSLNGTTILNTMALERGANILRVHDVAEAIECINLVEYMKTT